VSSLADVASLVIATMDLSIVKLLRSAIRTADIASANTVAPQGVYAQRPADRYEPAVGGGGSFAVLPPVGYGPCPTTCSNGVSGARIATAIDPTRIALQDLANDRIDRRTADGTVSCAATTPPAIQPPWRQLPWHEPMPAPKIVKVAPPAPDIVRTGKLIDFYS
jgi:hypothetical protein